MKKAKKKPLLVNFSEIEHSYINEKAQIQGVSMTGYIRSLIINKLTSEGFELRDNKD